MQTRAKARRVNGILGGLCKEHYPGLVEVSEGRWELATQFDHYKLAADAMDLNRNKYNDRAERVIKDSWDFFRCEEGKDERAAKVVLDSCRKHVMDMIHDARHQSHVWYYAKIKKQKLKKYDARKVVLPKEEYMLAIPNWCNRHRDA